MKKPLFPLVFLGAVILGADTSMADETAPSPITKLALFKNGLAAVERTITPAGKDSFLIDGNWEPVHGSVWFSASDFGKFTVTTVNHKRAVPNRDPYGNMTATYLGKQVQLVMQAGDQLVSYDGKVVDLVSDQNTGRKWNRNYGNSRYYGPVNRSAEGPADTAYLTLDADGSMITVPVAAIVAIHAKAINDVVWEEGNALAVNPREKMSLDAPFGMYYLSKGMTWSPSYRIVLGADDKMKLYMATTITNELESFRNVEVSLISGYPNIEYSNSVSPLAGDITLSDFFGGMAAPDGFREESMLMAQSAGNYRMAQDSSNYHVTAGAGSAEDIQYYQAGRLSLDEGESIYLPLDDAETSYERIVQWTIPDVRDNFGRNQYGSNMPERLTNDIWDAVRFNNPFKTAMTTAPVEIEQDGKLLGQGTSYWTNPGEENLIKITKALTVSGKIVESESDQKRPVVALLGNKFMNPDVDGVVTVKNFRSTEATVVIKLNFSGEFISADADGKCKQINSGFFYSVNKRNELSWEIKLGAGEEKSLQYKYSVLIYL